MNQVSPSLYDRIGVQAGIAKLLRHFYADVRQHRLIGPMFNERIKDWPAHLVKIGEFWARITGGPSSYARPDAGKTSQPGSRNRHLGAGLELWGYNRRCYLQPRSLRDDRLGA